MKKLQLFIALVFCFAINLQAQTITTGTVSTTVCSGATITVPYTITGTFTAGNVFTAELSNSQGSFILPFNIGTLTSTAAGTITATIPSSFSGSGYRIRVKSSAPVISGSNNGTNISIIATPLFIFLNQGGAASVCVNATTPAFTNIQTGGTWSIVAGTGTASVSTGGVVTGLTAGTVSVVYTQGTCYISASSVTVNALPTASISGNTSFCTGGNTVLTSNATAGSGTISSYQWKVGGINVASSGTSATYTATAAGSYTVTVTNSNGCSFTSSAYPVTETVNALPTITTSDTATAVCQSTSAQNTSLDYSATTNTPTTYSISWTATPTNSFVAVTDATLPTSPISIAVPANTAAGTYTGTLTVKNACGASSTGTSFTVKVIGMPSFSASSEMCYVQSDLGPPRILLC